ncbi:MAG: TRAP transporter small permease subunit [Bacteroidetes bacterium]|nr:TRAP transporter small permease subunit [Bacteroidota bacterium]MBU1114047.1 TRAP transporter small permease subunit [Bacteroidota bacterium]MBU1796812.1 TRAP transporter small permease subunit [Bacteroidota bacterium]
MKMLNNFILFVDKTNSIIGKYSSWLTTMLVLVVVYDVILRYVFNQSSVGMQELEWHIFAILFLMGSAFTLLKDDHVRVDLFYSRFEEKKKALINIIGIIVFFIPFVLLIIYTSINYVDNSIVLNEASPDPGGLPARYILKAFIPISFFFLLLQGFSLLFKSIITIKNINTEKN